MSVRIAVLLAISALLTGFFWGRSTVERREILESSLKPLPKYEPANQSVGHAQPTANQPSDGHWSLPASFLLKYWPIPTIDYATGKFEYETLVKYGLDGKGTKSLQTALNEQVDRLFELEVEHSRLITDAEGNQFFEIETFPAEGQQIKDSLNNLVVESLGTFPDQRGALLAAAATKHPVFNGFGQFKTEMAIELVGKEGAQKYALRMKSSKPNPIQDDVNIPLTGNYLAKRFQSLLEKHKSELKQP